jgi:hypothetical protein
MKTRKKYPKSQKYFVLSTHAVVALSVSSIDCVSRVSRMYGVSVVNGVSAVYAMNGVSTVFEVFAVSGVWSVRNEKKNILQNGGVF